jgi:hypothetical protein
LWTPWSNWAATGARSVVDGPECGATETAVVGELGLQAESFVVIKTEPLPIKDNLFDTGALHQLGLQVVLADDVLDFAL